ncbi:MAG: radical SAM family heme chaperone HemW [Ghiorsea sp.]
MNYSSPLRLYVHTPFCLHKCHYCDFNSHVFDEPPWQDYTQALIKELNVFATQTQFQNRKIHSIFFGGGTPSLAPASLFKVVLDEASQLFVFEDDIEITLEANPGATEANRFRGYLDAGINRLSIGVQSFDNQELKWLERIHSSDEAVRAYAMARDVGFSNINLDLMYALPNQSLEEWFISLEKGIALSPEHLSCYQLTVEPHTALHVTHKKQQLALPDEELALAFFEQTRNRLAKAGYHAYEISNFAKEGKHCRHNMGYWLYDDYIGIGAGAAGKWDTPSGGVRRYTNFRAPQRYIDTALSNGVATNSFENLEIKQSMGEAVWLGLRRNDGVDLKWFEQRFGQSITSVYTHLIRQGQDGNYLKIEGGCLKLTYSGLRLADDISASFLV